MEEPKLTRGEYYDQFTDIMKSVNDPNNELSHISFPSYEEYIMDFEGADHEELYAVNRLHCSPDATMYLMDAISNQIDMYKEMGWSGSLADRHMNDLLDQIMNFPVKGDGTYEQTGL